MKRFVRIILVLLALAAGASAGPNAKTAKLVSGTWNMGVRMKGLPTMMVIRQDGNIYPSFWFGANFGGTFSIIATEEALTDDLSIRSEGGFSLKFTKYPPKTGMEDQLPGGAWMRLSPFNMFLEFKEFTKWKRVSTVRGNEAGDVRLEAQFTGNFVAGNATAPITGTAWFVHKAAVAAFELSIEMTLAGSDFGLEGDQARPLHIKVHSYSSSSKDLPASGNQLEKIEIDE